MNDESIAKIATAKAVDDKTLKQLSQQLQPGVVTLDTKIRLVGGIKKGQPYQQRMAAAANPWALLARALNKLNGASIESLVKESLSATQDEAEAIKQAAQDAIDRIVDGTEREVSGRITHTLRWELLS